MLTSFSAVRALAFAGIGLGATFVSGCVSTTDPIRCRDELGVICGSDDVKRETERLREEELRIEQARARESVAQVAIGQGEQARLQAYYDDLSAQLREQERDLLNLRSALDRQLNSNAISRGQHASLTTELDAITRRIAAYLTTPIANNQRAREAEDFIDGEVRPFRERVRQVVVD